MNTEFKAIFAVASFHNSSGQFGQNLRGALILVSLSVAVSTYRSTKLTGLCCKVLLIALDEIPDVCSSCF